MNDDFALTALEEEILDCLLEAMSNKAIALRLVTVEGTVKMHIHHLARKLHMHSRVAMALWWYKQKMVP